MIFDHLLDFFFSSLVYILSKILLVYFLQFKFLLFFCFVDFHGQFYVWAVYGVAVWGTVVLQTFSSWEMRW
jgi:hypothetical protein